MPEPAANWNSFLEVAPLTHVGLRRANNQDSHSVAMAGSETEWRERGHLFVVADGMGAHAAGELASKLACGGVAHTYHKLLDKPPPEALKQAIEETNAQIHGRGEANAEFHGMGTTCSVLAILPQGAIVGQVGDSRVYRLRNHKLEQLTFDHSLVWEMMAAGQIPNEGEGASFVPKNIITRSLGPHAEVKVDLEGPFPLELGDTFLLCSDGLTGQVKDDEIGALLGALSPKEAAQALIDLANLRGGPDNITVIIARVSAPPPQSDGSAVRRSKPFGQRISEVHPGFWIASIALLILAVVCLSITQPIAAIACAAGGVLAAIIAIAQALGNEGPEIGLSSQAPLGAGPHRAYQCPPNGASAANLATILQELRDTATEKGWRVDWAGLDALTERGRAAATEHRYEQAIHEYALAISFLMQQLRSQ